jgi:hypothetical protein
MVAYNDGDQGFSDDCPHLNKAIKCATNAKTFDNGCEFENIRDEASDILKRLIKDENFSSCGVTAQHIDNILLKGNYFYY